MPRVPVVTPQETLRPLPNAELRPAPSQLPEIGAALEQAGAGLTDIAIQQQNQQNLERVQAAEAGLKDELRQFEASVSERRGQNAWGVTGEAEKWWEDKTQDYMDGLENDAQREALRTTVAPLRDRSLTAIGNHESHERAIATEEATKASIAGSISLAASHATDPEARDVARDDILKRIQALSLANGWSPERREFEVRKDLTALHTEVLANLVDLDPAAARDYLDKHRGEIDGAKLDDLEQLVKRGTLRERAQAGADEIMAAGLTRTDALDRARRKYTGDVRDEVVTRIRQRYAERDAARQQAEADAADQAWKIFADTGTVASLPTELVGRLDGRTLISLRKEEQARRDGSDVSTDWDLYLKRTDEAVDNPEAFVRRDLRQDFGSLAPTQRRELIRLQQELRASPMNSTDMATLSQQLSNAHDLLQITGTKNAEDRGQFDSAVTNAVQAEADRLGRKLSYDERQQIIDRYMIEGSVPGRIFSHGRRYYEVYGTDEAARFTADIPEVDRAQIVEALQAAGYEATEARIIHVWVQRQHQ